MHGMASLIAEAKNVVHNLPAFFGYFSRLGRATIGEEYK